MTFTSENKQNEFNKIITSVKECNKCKRMCNRKKVLSENNGNINSKVMFIAEAPGRLGAEQTGIPLYGDKTGENFDTLLNSIGWRREEIFITNSILCNPQKTNGNNSAPTDEEIENCSIYLKETLNLINPDVVVTLGCKALSALNIIYPHNYTLRNHAGNIQSWNNKNLYPLYHPSPKGMINRKFYEQIKDFINLLLIVNPLSGLKDGEFNYE
jgi:uracil-DNA glycosylase family 4